MWGARSLLLKRRVQRRFLRLLCAIAESRPHSRKPFGQKSPRKMVHVSPTYFDEQSIVGGGERYAESLATAMAEKVDNVTLVSFGDKSHCERRNNVTIKIYAAMGWIEGVRFDPVCLGFLKEFATADIIHCHQYRTFVTALSILVGYVLGKRVFVTDYGGWSSDFSDRYTLDKYVTGFLPISAFSVKTLPNHRNVKVIYGGVSRGFLEMKESERRERTVLYVGRIMPHKGINYLIEAVDDGVELDIIGRVYHREYSDLLQQLALGKQIRFNGNASDEGIIAAYRRACVTVLPSVYVDVYGNQYQVPELLGLTLLESMACGTPVICTAVGGMPEIVEDGVTGFVVPPNDPQALRDRIYWLLSHPDDASLMGRNARDHVLKHFTWSAIAEQCLKAYVE